ncbi:methyl-accepting chemotaxis protein [Undibacterium oligocarboniphilum]|uniref:Cache domain-containing protein n=1 Tax=Undibacterium oligocarboniphilum TaxID=666702 RepID=A0A850QGY3_9BURK|nr:methyl-accepting chemotaxis protein [Undibacterium oligocarboniphilum]MBC3868653.1 cache domain-containing protein [Undibacterium oligocarboniphilum]NVO76633.1 cache domain-containing protein [Undibacterium oligocarboniphilum]
MSAFLALQRLSISRRLGILIIGAVIGIFLLTATFLTSEKGLILQERQSNVRQTVETTEKLVEFYYGQFKSGKLTEVDAQQAAKDALRVLRYGQKEYFWINDMQTVMVMHPIKPELEGKNQSATQDPTGKHLFSEMVDIVKKDGEGYVYYMWPKPGNAEPVQKVSFVKGFAPWGWVIGSGVYIDSINATFYERLMEATAGAAILTALLVAVSLFIVRGLIRQLGGEPDYAATMTRHIAAGNLTEDIVLRDKDNSSLLFSIKTMRDSIAHLIGEVKTSTDAISGASKEIASGNMDLSSRTESQASSLEETASSMEELTSTVQHNADNTRQANQLAASATDVAVKGGAVVSEVISTMTLINASSQKIVDIISVIDGIAFQTNILALNAAVEAARAGEQGRGFAVVASEVRNLAQRSATAAKEIKVLINDSVESVDHGSKLVDKAGQTMTEISDSVRRVTDVIAEITAATTEQSHGIGQINLAITEMDNVTQQNAALVEEAAAAAAAMQDQTEHLLKTVSVFKLKENDLPQARTSEKKTLTPVRTAATTAVHGKRTMQAAPKKALPVKIRKIDAKPQQKTEDQWEEF